MGKEIQWNKCFDKGSPRMLRKLRPIQDAQMKSLLTVHPGLPPQTPRKMMGKVVL